MGLFSIKQIVCKHYTSVKGDSSAKRFSAIFFLFPAAVSVGMVLLGFTVSKDTIQLLVPALSVLIGFSINSLALLASQDRTGPPNALADNIRNLASYALIIGIVLLVFTIILSLAFSNSYLEEQALVTAVSAIVYFVVGHYVLTLLLIPSRLYVTVET
jgi:ABC-type transport system involved in cytochrome c biogenesis permease subunit